MFSLRKLGEVIREQSVIIFMTFNELLNFMMFAWKLHNDNSKSYCNEPQKCLAMQSLILPYTLHNSHTVAHYQDALLQQESNAPFSWF